MNCMEHLLRADLNRDWLSLMLIGAIVLLGILRYRFPKRMVELMLLPINDRYFALEGRQKGLGHPFNIVMLGVQIMAFGLFLGLVKMTQDNSYANITSNLWLESIHFKVFFKAMMTFGLYLFLRYSLDWGVGYIFNCQKLLSVYRYERLSFHHLLALVVLIFLTIVFFSRISFALITPVILILVVFGLLMTLIYSLRRNSTTLFTNFLYFILYICALEIAPYALLYQAAMA